jgi:hypothetical protein
LREQVKAIHGVLRGNYGRASRRWNVWCSRSRGGNCLNWVVGHLMETWDMVLPLVGEEPVLGAEHAGALQTRERGAARGRGGFAAGESC